LPEESELEAEQDIAIADCRYRLNEPAVVADIIDGEVVIMNLERGSYYNLDQNGTSVWRLVVDGFTPAEIAATAAAHYGVPETDVSLDIDRLIAKLVEEQLIVPVREGAADRSITAAAFPLDVYAPSTLAIYSDMKDLLALDPPLPFDGDQNA
jgi:hypothetical protein